MSIPRLPALLIAATLMIPVYAAFAAPDAPPPPPAAGAHEEHGKPHDGRFTPPASRQEAIDRAKERTAKLEAMSDDEWKKRQEERMERRKERQEKREERHEKLKEHAKEHKGPGKDAAPAAGGAH